MNLRKLVSWAFFGFFTIALFSVSTIVWMDFRAVSEPGRSPAANPFSATTESFVDGIYTTASGLAKIPFEAIKSHIIRYKLKEFLAELPLSEDVRKRVTARIESGQFMDESVPFVFALKEQYVAPEGSEHRKFDAYIRKLFAQNSVEGLEHSMFRFQKDEQPQKGFAVPPGLIVHAVNIYDAIFLQSKISPMKGKIEIDTQTLARVKPAVKALMEAFLPAIDPGSDIHEALQAFIKNDERLETVTISLIQAINQYALKSYMVFVQKFERQQDLERWLNAEMNKDAGGQLWDYLRFAQNERRYGVQTVVDGLQGQLMRELSSATSGRESRFLKTLLKEHATQLESKKPSGRKVSSSPAQQIRFLEFLANNRFESPAYLPFFRELFAKQGNGVATQGISTTPTISVRNLPIAKTGAPVTGPGGSGVPNFHFLDRAKDRAYYFFGNDALLLDEIVKTQGMTSMFERLSRHNTLNCNAQYDFLAKASYDGLLNLALGEKMRDFGDLLCVLDLEKRAVNETQLRKLRKNALSYENAIKKSSFFKSLYKDRLSSILREIAALEDQGLPQYVLYYNPWPDHFAHFKGPFSDEILSPTGELNRLDYWLGQIATVYRNAGLADRTLFAMAGDHGLTPVYHLVNPEVEVFDALKEQGIPLVIEKISSDEGEGPKITNPKNPPSMRGKDVVIASTAGGNYMMDLFVNQDSGWKKQPLYSDLTRWKTLSGQTLDLPSEIYSRLKDTLDYMVIRERGGSPIRQTIRVIASRDGIRKDLILYRAGKRVFLQGEDSILELDQPSPYRELSAAEISEQRSLYQRCVRSAVFNSLHTWCDEASWRRLANFSPRPDSVVQLSHLYDTDLAGTINLFPKAGMGYNTKVPGRHAGEHFHEKDAFVGFWGLSSNVIPLPQQLDSAVNGSLAPTVYQYITGKPVTEGSDGWGFPSVYPALQGQK